MDNTRFIDESQIMTTLGDCVHNLSDSAYRTDEPYLKAIDKITERINYNSSFFDSVNRSDVLKVVNRYVRRLEQNPSIKPYSTYFTVTQPKKEYFQTATDVANSAGVEISLARKILTNLEYADSDGSIVKGIWNPREKPKQKTASNNKPSTNNNPDPIKGLPDDYGAGKDPEGENIDYIKWGALGLTGGLLLLYLVKRKK